MVGGAVGERGKREGRNGARARSSQGRGRGPAQGPSPSLSPPHLQPLHSLIDAQRPPARLLFCSVAAAARGLRRACCCCSSASCNTSDERNVGNQAIHSPKHCRTQPTPLDAFFFERTQIISYFNLYITLVPALPDLRRLNRIIAAITTIKAVNVFKRNPAA